MRAEVQSVIETLKDQLTANTDILTAILFGSVVKDDLWPHSDIDLFIVLATSPVETGGAQLTCRDVPVHVQYFSKPSFLQKAGGLMGRPFHTALAHNRLLVDRDAEIAASIARIKTMPDADRKIRTVEELSIALYELYHSEKHSYCNRPEDAAVARGRAWEHWARAQLFWAGRLPERGALAQARQSGLIADTAPAGSAAALKEMVAAALPKMAVDIVERISQAGRPMSEDELDTTYEKLGAEVVVTPLLDLLVASGALSRSVRPFALGGMPLAHEIVYTPREEP